MNNMYDILAKMKLLEGRGSKPDFLDLDKDGNRTEPMKKAAKEVDEASYSAKAARAGKDIGKPGKAFAQIAKSAGERYGSKESGEKVAGAVLAKLRAKESVEESDMDESALQAYLGKKKYGDAGMKALQKAGRDGASKETMARIRARHDKMDEADVDEGNKFAHNVLKAKAAGLKQADLDGDGDMEKVLEREFGSRDDFDTRAKKGDTVRTAKGTLIKTDSGVRHERRHEDDDTEDTDHDDAPKKKGRPKGTKRAIGAKVKGTSKLHSKPAIKETDLEEDYDQDEYDEEGEMAKSQSRTIADAAEELQRMLGDNENLPEWVQKKITLAQSYIDSARDYLAANRPQDEMMAEKAVSKAQRAAAGIAYAAKKGDIPKSELRGASKEMSKMPAGELKKFAKTKEKDLPEKKKEESVEETTVAGSVATAPATTGKKGGMIFGKGVYESQIAESFDKKLKTVLTEGISINASQGEDGQKTLTVNATDDDAIKLAQILQLAGMPQGQGYEETCSACGQTPCGCEEGMAEGEYANSPDVEESDTDTMVNTLSGGLNGKKSTGQTTIPVIASQLSRQMSQVREETETRLWDLYKRYES
jgi:hypothetical protein